MMRLFILFTLSLALFANHSNAQEFCNNGIDDDGDGFIDCYDKDCIYNITCEDFFLGDPMCDVKPETFPPVEMKLKFKSGPSQAANHVSRIIAGDINGDGKTELVSTYTNDYGNTGISARKINVFEAPASGPDLNLTSSTNVSIGGHQAEMYDDIAMADINSDGCAEIFVTISESPGVPNYQIVAYDCNGSQVWASPISFSFHPGLIGLADFDHDGLVELYSRTQIFDAHTGRLLGKNNIDDVNTGIHSGVNKGWGMNSNAPVAVDIIPANPGLELVAGCRIYGVTINRGAMFATLTLMKDFPSYATRTARGQSNPTSVADFNQDGFLDVLAIGSNSKYDNNTTIFFWDVKNDVIRKFSDPMGTGDYKTGWKNGGGRISIADIDGDGLMNAVYVSGGYLYALKEAGANLGILWKETVADQTSGFTGCTTFDLNGDGKSEVVYRDENYLRTYTTDTTGVVTQSLPMRCSSRTHHEYPVVADIDGDGAAEICVTCDILDEEQGHNLGYLSPGQLRVYESANKPWVPARKVWNQHGYFVTNVNDDLTIPRVQQLHHLVFANDAPCRTTGISRPLNSFMGQAAYLDAFGCPSFPTPDLALVPFSSGRLIEYTPFSCTDEYFQVTFKYTNQGNMVLDGTLEVSFYDGDPTLSDPLVRRLDTKSILLAGMSPDDTITTSISLRSLGGAFDLYVVLNDNGTTIPLDIPQQSGHITECIYNNNVVNARIVPRQAPLVAELIRDNRKCLVVPPGASVPPDDGIVQAYVPIGNVRDHINFDFYWSIGTTAKPFTDADYVGPNYTGLGAGAYTVYAVHKAGGCGSDTVTVVVGEVISRVDARIILGNDFGELSVIVNDADYDGVGDPVDNFNYGWFSGVDILNGDTLGTSYRITDLDTGTYSVLVFDKATGCYGFASTSIGENVSRGNNVLGAGEDGDITGVAMYPNPGTDGFTIRIDNGYVGDVQLQLQSVLGNEVGKTFSRHKGTRTLTVPVETLELKPGVYLVKISLGTGSVRRKWIKL
jgi:large repetitive protein